MDEGQNIDIVPTYTLDGKLIGMWTCCGRERLTMFQASFFPPRIHPQIIPVHAARFIQISLTFDIRGRRHSPQLTMQNGISWSLQE
jgi:hypothetical protein